MSRPKRGITKPAADGERAFFLKCAFIFSLNADRAPQLKAGVKPKVKDGLPVKRWVLISGSLGLLASAVSYTILLNTDTIVHYKARAIAILIWPTGVFLMANEFATSSREIAGNFAMAIGGNMVLYIAGGLVLYGLTDLVRRLRR